MTLTPENATDTYTSPRWLLLAFAVMVACGGPPQSEPTPTPAPAGRWTGAMTIDGAPAANTSCNIANKPGLGGTGQGGALAVWLSECSIWAARYVRSGAWSDPEPIGVSPPGAAANWLWEPTLATNGDVAVAVWATQVTLAGPELWAARWTAASGWDSPERIDGSAARGFVPDSGGPAVAIDGSGNALVLWASGGIVATRFVAGSGWISPARLSGVGSDPTVQFDVQGRALAGWTEDGAVALTWFEPEHGWGPVTRLQPPTGYRFSPPEGAALDGTGRAVVTFARQRLQRIHDSFTLWSALFDGQTWKQLPQVSRVGVGAGDSHLGVDSRGRGLGVWDEDSGPAFAHFDFMQGWQPPQAAIVAPGATRLDLAVAENGTAVLVWAQPDAQFQERIEASQWNGSAWGEPEAIQATSKGGRTASVTIDSCGNAIAVWAEYEGERTRIKANRLDAGCR